MNKTPIWAVLAPASPRWLKERGVAIWRGEDERAGELSVIAGRGPVSAVVAYDPLLTDGELPFAEDLARELDGVVWATRPIDAIELGPEGSLVWRVERGRATEELAEDPFALAERLGVPLREPRPSRLRSVAVVADLDPDAVRTAFGEDGQYYAFERNRRGTLVYAPKGTRVDASNLLFALPSATVYAVLRGPSSSRFGVHVQKGASTLGAFELDDTRLANVPSLEDFEGQRTAEDILQVLDVPPRLLGY